MDRDLTISCVVITGSICLVKRLQLGMVLWNLVESGGRAVVLYFPKGG